MLIQKPCNLIEIPADFTELSSQRTDSRKQIFIDGRDSDNWLDDSVIDCLTYKFRLVNPTEFCSFSEIGVFIIGHSGFDDNAAFGCVVFLWHISPLSLYNVHFLREW